MAYRAPALSLDLGERKDMLRTLTGAVAALALAAPLLAGEIIDTNLRFRFMTPDGWTTEAPPTDAVAVVVASPRKPDTRGNCNVVAGANGTQGMSQTQLEEMASPQFTEAFWKSTLANVKLFKTSKVDNFGERQQHGRKVFFVKSTSQAELLGQTLTVTQLMDIHLTPGQSFAVTCTALADAFDREARDFETIMVSFEPTPQLNVADVRTMRVDRKSTGTLSQTLAGEGAAAGLTRAGRSR